jgi:hypothetical protein
LPADGDGILTRRVGISPYRQGVATARRRARRRGGHGVTANGNFRAVDRGAGVRSKAKGDVARVSGIRAVTDGNGVLAGGLGADTDRRGVGAGSTGQFVAHLEVIGEDRRGGVRVAHIAERDIRGVADV